MRVELDPLPAEDLGEQDLGVEPGALGPLALEEVGRSRSEAADGPASSAGSAVGVDVPCHRASDLAELLAAVVVDQGRRSGGRGRPG